MTTYKDVEIDLSEVGEAGSKNAQEVIDEIDQIIENCYELLTCIEL